MIRALESREARADHLHLRVEWRTYRAPSDKAPGDREHWWRMKPGVDPDYDIEYHIARPWWRLSLFDTVEKKQWPVNAWVDGELRRLQSSFGKENYRLFTAYRIKSASWLRGRVYMTPVELEMFDMKESFLELLRQAPPNTVTVTPEGKGVTAVEFPHPTHDYTIMRGKFDRERDWVPLFYEQYTPRKEGDSWKPMSYAMETVEAMPIGNSHIVSKALIINRNPNLSTDMMVVMDYQVVDAKRDESITAETLRIEIPTKSTYIYDLVRLEDKILDEAGNVVKSETIDLEEVREGDRALAQAAAAIAQASEERLERQGYFAWLVGAAGVVAVAGAVVFWFRRRRLAA
ncbi:MAG: hypothetical protein ACE5EC_01125 [Phycisphaerae bacterium]